MNVDFTLVSQPRLCSTKRCGTFPRRHSRLVYGRHELLVNELPEALESCLGEKAPWR